MPTPEEQFGDLWNTPAPNFRPGAPPDLAMEQMARNPGGLSDAGMSVADYQLQDWRAQLTGLGHPSELAFNTINNDIVQGLLAPTALDPFFGPAPPPGSLDFSNASQNLPGSYVSNWQDFPGTFHSAQNVAGIEDFARQIENSALSPPGPGEPNLPAPSARSQALANLAPERWGAAELANLGGSTLPSTNDWRALPAPYNRPGMIMRNGRIIDTTSSSFKMGVPMGAQYDSPGAMGPGSSRSAGGYSYGFPGALNWGIGGQAVFWPGDVSGQIIPTSYGFGG
jgi:hypothetical protein